MRSVGEFLIGWRRKAGLVTLAMAVVFAMAWIRGMIVYDVVKFTIGNQQIVLLCVDSAIVWESWNRNGDAPMWEWKRMSPTNRTLTGVKIATIGGIPFSPVTFHFHIFTWWLVLPLTLLSAWLILGKPRKAKGVP